MSRATLFSLFLAGVLCPLVANAAAVRLQFEAENPAGTAHYVIQRRASTETWTATPVEPVTGAGSVIGQNSRSSGTITVTQSANTITASADLFLADDANRQIRFGASGPVDFIAAVTGPRTAIAATGRTVVATVCTIFADQLELVDPGVMPGLYVYRATAQRPDGTDRSPSFSSDSVVVNIPVNAPSSLEVVVQLSGFTNISTRGEMGGGNDSLIAGFSAPRPFTVLVRAVGPSLAQFGIPDPVAHPRLRLMRGNQEIAANAGWADDPAIAAAAASVNAFALAPGSSDAALLIQLEAGAYTMICDPENNRKGIGLAEVYLVN